MAESDSIERKTGNFALARAIFLQTLEAGRITEARDVQAHFAREQHSSRRNCLCSDVPHTQTQLQQKLVSLFGLQYSVGVRAGILATPLLREFKGGGDGNNKSGISTNEGGAGS